MALSKTGRFLSKAEILGVGLSSPLSIECLPECLLRRKREFQMGLFQNNPRGEGNRRAPGETSISWEHTAAR